MFARIRQMIIKEFIQVLRDSASRFSLIVPPIMQILIFGYAANFEVHHVNTAVLDFDHSQESRELIARLGASDYFDVDATLTNHHQLARAIDRGDVALALQILPGFAENLRRQKSPEVQVILDGTNSNTALIALGYVSQIGQRYANDYQLDYLNRVMPTLAAKIPAVE